MTSMAVFKYTNKAILIAIIIVSILCRNIWILNDNIYFIGDAICWVLILVCLRNNLVNAIDKLICDLVLWMTVSNLMDELFFNPLKIGANEIVFGILMIIYCIRQMRHVKGSDSKRIE
jgi:hypothetical protein